MYITVILYSHIILNIPYRCVFKVDIIKLRAFMVYGYGKIFQMASIPTLSLKFQNLLICRYFILSFTASYFTFELRM